MAALHLSEEEQAERVKAWWKVNGTSVIAGTVLGIAVIVGVNYWRVYRNDRAEAASALYAQLLQAQDAAHVTELGQQLIHDYSGTPYAGKAALVLAETAFEQGNLDAARDRLQWAMGDAPDPADRKIARLRLARVALSDDKPDEASSLLSGMAVGGYESAYQELLGDVAVEGNEPSKAAQAYRAALDALPPQSGFAPLLDRKLDAAIGASK